jgi:hypothetical protein
MALSSSSDVDSYDVIKKLLDYVFKTRQEQKKIVIPDVSQNMQDFSS